MLHLDALRGSVLVLISVCSCGAETDPTPRRPPADDWPTADPAALREAERAYEAARRPGTITLTATSTTLTATASFDENPGKEVEPPAECRLITIPVEAQGEDAGRIQIFPGESATPLLTLDFDPTTKKYRAAETPLEGWPPGFFRVIGSGGVVPPIDVLIGAGYPGKFVLPEPERTPYLTDRANRDITVFGDEYGRIDGASLVVGNTEVRCPTPDRHHAIIRAPLISRAVERYRERPDGPCPECNFIALRSTNVRRERFGNHDVVISHTFLTTRPVQVASR